METRYNGTFRIGDLDAFKAAIVDMSDNQLVFLANILRKFYPDTLQQHREALIEQMALRVVGELYLKNMAH